MAFSLTRVLYGARRLPRSQMYDSSLRPRITEIEATPDLSFIKEGGSMDTLVTAMNQAVAYNAIGLAFANQRWVGNASQRYIEQMKAENQKLGCFLPVYPSEATRAAVTPLLQELYPNRGTMRTWHGAINRVEPRTGSYAERCIHMLKAAPNGTGRRWRRHFLEQVQSFEL